MNMKYNILKLNFFIFFIFFSISLVSALPVSFYGDINITNSNNNDIELKVVSSLEEYKSVFNNSYVIDIAGKQGTNTTFYIWDEKVNTTVQPVQTSNINLNLSFTKIGNNGVCKGGNNKACSSNNCLFNVCKPSGWKCWIDSQCQNHYVCKNSVCEQIVVRRTSGGSGWIPKEYNCADNIDNDGDGLTDWDGNGNSSMKDPDCMGRYDGDEFGLNNNQTTSAESVELMGILDNIMDFYSGNTKLDIMELLDLLIEFYGGN